MDYAHHKTLELRDNPVDTDIVREYDENLESMYIPSSFMYSVCITEKVIRFF